MFHLLSDYLSMLGYMTYFDQWNDIRREFSDKGLKISYNLFYLPWWLSIFQMAGLINNPRKKHGQLRMPWAFFLWFQVFTIVSLGFLFVVSGFYNCLSNLTDTHLPLFMWVLTHMKSQEWYLRVTSESSSVMSNPATTWIVACQALLSLEFCRPEYWSG